jgi:3D (Asp-Asp-Asp) domain-containing protein
MFRFSSRRIPKAVSSVASVLATFTLIVSLSGALDTVLAADDPTSNGGKSPQVSPLDIPGSFKELPAAKDAVTAKQSLAQLESAKTSNEPSNQLTIDAEKVAADKVSLPGASTYPDSEMEDFHATAYCLKGRTASGVNTRPGVIAADPRVLPLGTVVHLRAGSYSGTYTVLDTGGRIKGRRVDVYVPTHKEAIQFGRRQVKIKVIGRGSSKGRTSKGLIASEM